MYSYTSKIIYVNNEHKSMLVEYTPDISTPVFMGLTTDGIENAPMHERVQFQVTLNIPFPLDGVELAEHIKIHAPLMTWQQQIENSVKKRDVVFTTTPIEVGATVNIENQELKLFEIDPDQIPNWAELAELLKK